MGKHTPNGDSLKEYRTLLLTVVQGTKTDIDYVRADVQDVKKDIVEIRAKDIPALQVVIAGIQGENRVKALVSGMVGGIITSGAVGIFVWWLNTQ